MLGPPGSPAAIGEVLMGERKDAFSKREGEDNTVKPLRKRQIQKEEINHNRGKSLVSTRRERAIISP